MTKNLYAIHLKFRGPVHLGSKKLDYGQSETQLRSDTIYSAIFQTWAMLGKEHLIPQTENETISFTLSSAFPFYYDGKKHHHFFPKPFGQLFQRTNDAIFIDHRKAIKKIAYLHEDAFFDWCRNGTIAIDIDQLKGMFYAQQLPANKLFNAQVVPRVKVAREEGEDATPYNLDRLYFYEGKEDHAGLYFLFNGDEQALNNLKLALQVLKDEGFGTDRKVGNGQFNYTIEPFKNPDWKGSSAVNLSLLLPKDKGWLKERIVSQNSGGYSLIERGGWITTPPLNTYRKNTLHFFEEGSLFHASSSEMTEEGTFKDLYPSESLAFENKPHPIWRVGKSLMFPVNFK